MENVEAGCIRVEVIVHTGLGQTRSVQLSLPCGSLLQAALQLSGACSSNAESTADALNADDMKCGVWGQLCRPDHALRDLDRVEVYRPLLVDPMEARRQRQRAQRRKSGRP